MYTDNTVPDLTELYPEGERYDCDQEYDICYPFLDLKEYDEPESEYRR